MTNATKAFGRRSTRDAGRATNDAGSATNHASLSTWTAAVAVAAALALAACSSPSPAAPSASQSQDPATASATAMPSETATAAPEQGATDGPTGGLTSFFDAPAQAEDAYQQALDAGRTDDAALLKLIAEQPQAVWLGEWLGADGAATKAGDIAAQAADAKQIPVFVIYAIPGRDCGLYSAGGLPEEQYLGFVQGLADAVEGKTAWFVLEPDALAMMGDCDGQGDRAGLLAEAARILDEAGGSVFLDSGHSNWRSVDDTAARINQVGTEHLAGFSTNTSNYNATANEQAWADQVSAIVGLPYIVDTSRNGNGSNGEWCNPRGRALGDLPALHDGGSMLATVWVKSPGESDGQCNGGPAAGAWWDEIALELARNA